MNTIPQETVVDWLDRIGKIQEAFAVALAVCPVTHHNKILDGACQIAVLQNGLLTEAVGPITVETKEAA